MQEYLEEIGLFTKVEIEYFLSQGCQRYLSKGANFIKEGELARKIAYVNTGLLRSYSYSGSSEEVTFCFTSSGAIITAYASYITGQQSRETIQALVDCELLEFPKNIIDELVASNRSWLLFSKSIAESEYLELEHRFFLLQKENALTRYKELYQNHSEYFRDIPLGYLASYLGISQRHLSRLRKQVDF